MPDRKGKRTKKVVKAIVYVGYSRTINSQTVTVTGEDGAGLITHCKGTTDPVANLGSQAVFAKNCEYLKTDASTGVAGRYQNTGTSASSTFSLMEGAEASVTSVTAGDGLGGGGTEGALTVNAMAGRGVTVRANNIDVGVNVYNTLGALGIGKLVNLSGFNTTLGITMVLADADAGVQATHVTMDAIANTTAGVVYPVGVAVGDATNNLDTSGRTIGDPVYLSNTAGGFVFTALTGADQLSQEVGIVKVVSATVGEIAFYPGALRLLKLPTTMFQPLSVTRAKLSAAAARNAVQATSATIATTGNTEIFFLVDETGSLNSADFNGVDVLAANDTNYITWSMVNLGQAGAGTTDMLAVSDANTTKATGGTALAANTKRALTVHGTPANLDVVAGDLIRVRAAATGTLANTVTIPRYCVRFTGTT